jgi:hypothetical protein
MIGKFQFRYACQYLDDGAPCHNTGLVRIWLINTFAEQWIGRNGPVA